MAERAKRCRRGVSLYLREDILEALERVSAESELSVSQLAEILLSYQLEMGGLIEKGSFLLELHRRFHRTR
ncbi:MAG TPA: hypothetical protein VLV18_07910 [Terriglobales bacterium]|nr:hypothetical protein [Terriglobales bacterium]